VLDALSEAGIRPYGLEGRDEARWVLLDFGDLIVHIFSEEDREFYSLERLWSDAPRVPDPAAAQT
jgi:ribosome-associated protein